MRKKVEVACWEYSHVSELFLTRKGEERLLRQIPELKAVCPRCKQIDAVNRPITLLSGQTIFNPFKPYSCSDGHLTLVSPLGKMLHIRYGPESFVNIEGNVEELSHLVDNKDVTCHHLNERGVKCGQKLEELNDMVLTRPATPGIKTKTRLGEIWDKAGLEPVRPNKINESTGDIEISKTDVANRARLQNIRRNRRNISPDRMPGQRIDKPTDTDYGRKNKGEIKSKW